ncbi:lipopolysaccharide biosynthesis protein [Halorubrum lipolyticum]|uniref:Export protein n=1 Tax=Halorubrum lipolyticum DSM 21995 TaxID=1227482 RepID=M0NQ66_9EURY|nr:lipopolysaccharide biosynthesis protein [Halorubrum lipolyticum]EMA59344.1 export protein [Halorubrum lipolyticum DSM 21995]
MKDRLRELVERAVPSGSVVQRTVKSGIWVTATKMAVRLSQLLMLLVLARLLSPRAFGLMGIALLVLSGIRRFTDIGINAALIQDKQENIDEYLNTTWTLEAARGVLIFGVLAVAAPFIAGVFDEPGATNLIRVLGLSPLLYGFRNPAIVYFQKDLSFHKDFVFKSSGSVVQFVVGVGYALYSPTVWALVFATVSKSFFKFILSYVLHDYRPRPAFEVAVARRLIDYGKWITGASIIGFVYSEGDDAFVGWFLSATALGFYQYAYRIADMPASEASGIISEITFPAYSRLQGDIDELRGALLQTTRLTAFVAFPLSFGIALVAPSFVPAVLGDEWRPMITAMQILALYGLLHSITRNFGAIWKALDRPDYIVKTGLLRVACIAAFIWPATARWGIEGTALVVVGVYVFPMLPLDVYLSARMVKARQRQLYAEYLYPFVAASVMFGTLWYAAAATELTPLVEFLVLVPSGAVVYFAVAFLLERRFDWGIERNLRMISDGIRG